MSTARPATTGGDGGSPTPTTSGDADANNPSTPPSRDDRQAEAHALITRTLADEAQAATEAGYTLSPPATTAIRNRLMLQLESKWGHEDQVSGTASAAAPAGLDSPPDAAAGSRGTAPRGRLGSPAVSPPPRLGTAPPSVLDDPMTSSDDEGNASRSGGSAAGFSSALSALSAAVSPEPLSPAAYAAMKEDDELERKLTTIERQQHKYAASGVSKVPVTPKDKGKRPARTPMAQRSNSPATPPDLKEGGSGTTPATPGSATKVSKQSVFAGFKAAWRSFKTEVEDFKEKMAKPAELAAPRSLEHIFGGGADGNAGGGADDSIAMAYPEFEGIASSTAGAGPAVERWFAVADEHCPSGTALLSRHRLFSTASSAAGVGRSADTDRLFAACERASPTMLVVRLDNGATFGAYCSHPWAERYASSDGYFGDGSCFLWRENAAAAATDRGGGGGGGHTVWHARASSTDPADPVAGGGGQPRVMRSRGDGIAIGAGAFGHAIQLAHDLRSGVSYPGDTFGNEALTKTDTQFSVEAVEVWGFGAAAADASNTALDVSTPSKAEDDGLWL